MDYLGQLLSQNLTDLLALEPWRQAAVFLPLGVLLLICTYTDFKEKKVYNKYTYPFAGVGLLCHTMAYGVDGLVAALMGGIISFVLGFIFFLTKGMRGGDVKLFTVVGIFLGAYANSSVFVYSMLVGSIGGLAKAIATGYIWTMFQRIGRFLRGLFRSVAYQTNMTEKLETDERSWIPFSVYVLIGTILTYTDAYFEWPLLFERITQLFRV